MAAMTIGTVSVVSPATVLAETCSLARELEAPMFADNTDRPLIAVQVDGQPRKFMLNTGGF